MRKLSILFCLLFAAILGFSQAQKKIFGELTVTDTIETNKGYKFPDGSFQSTSGGASINVSDSLKAGVTDSLLINTNALVVRTNGNIGVGTAAPNSKLEVNGILRITRLQGVNDLTIVPESSGEPVYSVYLGTGRTFGLRSNGVVQFGLQGAQSNGGEILYSPVGNNNRIRRGANTFIQFGGASIGVGDLSFESNRADGATSTGITWNQSAMSISGAKLFEWQEAGVAVMTIDKDGDVGIGTTNPDATSILDLTTTTKGVLIPRMTETQRDAISSPATGLQIFDNTNNVLNFYNGTQWQRFTHTTTATLTNGSVIFSMGGSELDDDNANFFWNNTNKNLGIGTNNQNISSLLDLTSTTKGFLPPRMTTTQRDAISTPVAGLMIFNTSFNRIEFYDGTIWTYQARTKTGSYTGNGTSQSIAVGFNPKIIKIYNTSAPEFMLKNDQFVDDDFLKIEATRFILKTANGITLTTTGFDLGSSSVINNNAVSYLYEAIE